MRSCTICRKTITASNGLVATGPKAAKDGLRPTCRECHNDAQRARRTMKATAATSDAVGFLLKGAIPPEARPTPSDPRYSSPRAPPPELSPPSPPSPLRPVASPPVALTSSSLERFVIIPDVHHPEAHADYRVMLRAMQVFRPEGIMCLGDFADASSLSAHAKTERGADDFKAEVDAVSAELDILDRLPGVKWKKYIEGNHEWRLQRYLANNAQALMGMLDIKSCLHLVERGWEFTPYMHHTRVGKVHFTHDTGQAGANAHRSARDIFMGSAVIGHTHRMAYEVRGVWGGPPVVTAMFGWLGNPEKITYVHQAAAAMWPRGFGLGYHNLETGLVYMVPVPIVNGTCVIEGVLVS